jgi:hypothetical protein
LLERIKTMTIQVTATFVLGMFKPDQALPLAEQARVKLTIEPLAEQLEPTEAWQSLKAWIKQNPLHGLGRHLTRSRWSSYSPNCVRKEEEWEPSSKSSEPPNA